jgi:hypothetical protein
MTTMSRNIGSREMEKAVLGTSSKWPTDLKGHRFSDAKTRTNLAGFSR